MAFSPDGRLLATAGPEDLTRLWDPLRDEQLLRLQGAQKTVFSLAFSPKGDRLATGGSDTTALVWDVRPARRALIRPRRKVSPDEWASVWGELTGSALEAYRAIARLTDEPEKAILLLRGRLQPAVLDNRRLLKLIANLDSDSFADREKTMRELETFGERAEPAILKALGQRQSLEIRRRLEGLCEKLARSPLDRETLRALRAVEALEQIGTTEARRLLKKLAGGTPDARLTREAQSSLRRLAKLPTDKR